MKVLITGAEGQVGRALVTRAPSGARLDAVGRRDLDITDAKSVEAFVQRSQPDVIINAAAYTAVDRAETDVAAAVAANVTGPENLARVLARRSRGRLLHVSTDFVFDGSERKPYVPTHPASPLGAYGRSKREGERAVLDLLGPRAVILRTAWVYAAQGRNFLLTMLRLMREKGGVRVVADQYGTPTAAASVAQALWVAAERPEVTGILHWTDAGSASWYEFALAIATEARGLGLLPNLPGIVPITTADYPTPALRPAYSVLDKSSTVAALGISPRDWRETLRETLREISVA